MEMNSTFAGYMLCLHTTLSLFHDCWRNQRSPFFEKVLRICCCCCWADEFTVLKNSSALTFLYHGLPVLVTLMLCLMSRSFYLMALFLLLRWMNHFLEIVAWFCTWKTWFPEAKLHPVLKFGVSLCSCWPVRIGSVAEGKVSVQLGLL